MGDKVPRFQLGDKVEDTVGDKVGNYVGNKAGDKAADRQGFKMFQDVSRCFKILGRRHDEKDSG